MQSVTLFSRAYWMRYSFYQLGKAKFWKTWIKQHSNNNESLTRTFIHLGNQPTNIDSNDIDIIAKYIYNCYGLDTSSDTSFEALRLHQLLSTPNNVFENLHLQFLQFNNM